jgi:hypothetical protein
MSLEAENRKAVVDYRMEKAGIALEDADFLTEAGKYNIAAIDCIMRCIMPHLPY